jgi:2-polyprenyl-6-methoxyphenol hydroxylase-like FAD-dependent oxidoreductase
LFVFLLEKLRKSGEARELGLDYGTNLVLEQYAKMREPDNLAMLAITDSLNCLFSHDSAPINILRKLGIATVNQVPYLQKFFMRYATFHHHLK